MWIQCTDRKTKHRKPIYTIENRLDGIEILLFLVRVVIFATAVAIFDDNDNDDDDNADAFLGAFAQLLSPWAQISMF